MWSPNNPKTCYRCHLKKEKHRTWFWERPSQWEFLDSSAHLAPFSEMSQHCQHLFSFAYARYLKISHLVSGNPVRAWIPVYGCVFESIHSVLEGSACYRVLNEGGCIANIRKQLEQRVRNFFRNYYYSGFSTGWVCRLDNDIRPERPLVDLLCHLHGYHDFWRLWRHQRVADCAGF